MPFNEANECMGFDLHCIGIPLPFDVVPSGVEKGLLGVHETILTFLYASSRCQTESLQ